MSMSLTPPNAATPNVPPDVGPPIIPPGLTRIPLNQLEALNVPATDNISRLLQTGSGVSTEAPSESIRARPVTTSSQSRDAFTPGNAAADSPGRPQPTTSTSLAPAATTFAVAAAAPNAIVAENQLP